MTGGFVCTLLQLAFNEMSIARIKYVSRRVQVAQPGMTGNSIEQSQPPPTPLEEERPKPLVERILLTLGFKPISDEEYLEKLKFKRDFYLRRIAELEEERHRETQNQPEVLAESQPSKSS